MSTIIAILKKNRDVKGIPFWATAKPNQSFTFRTSHNLKFWEEYGPTGHHYDMWLLHDAPSNILNLRDVNDVPK